MSGAPAGLSPRFQVAGYMQLAEREMNSEEVHGSSRAEILGKTTKYQDF